MCGQPTGGNTAWILRPKGDSRVRVCSEASMECLCRTCSASHLSSWRWQWRTYVKCLQVTLNREVITLLEGKAATQRALTRLVRTTHDGKRRVYYKLRVPWRFLSHSLFLHSLASCASANISYVEMGPVNFYLTAPDSLCIYSHEYSNRKENQLYHFISLEARTPVPPLCPCFQHFLMKTPSA